MKKSGVMFALAFCVSGAMAEVAVQGAVYEMNCGDSKTLLEEVQSVCMAQAGVKYAGGERVQPYLVLKRKNDAQFLRLAPEKVRLARPQGCKGYDAEGVTYAGKKPFHTAGTVVFCDNLHMKGKKGHLSVTLHQGKQKLEAKVDTDPVLQTE